MSITKHHSTMKNTGTALSYQKTFGTFAIPTNSTTEHGALKSELGPTTVQQKDATYARRKRIASSQQTRMKNKQTNVVNWFPGVAMLPVQALKFHRTNLVLTGIAINSKAPVFLLLSSVLRLIRN